MSLQKILQLQPEAGEGASGFTASGSQRSHNSSAAAIRGDNLCHETSSSWPELDDKIVLSLF